MDVPVFLDIIEGALILFLGIRLFSVGLDRDIARDEAKRFRRDLQNYTVTHSSLLNLISQAEKLGWDLNIKQKKPALDDQTQKLLILATDPRTNENEARAAAVQVCKRLKRMK